MDCFSFLDSIDIPGLAFITVVFCTMAYLFKKSLDESDARHVTYIISNYPNSCSMFKKDIPFPGHTNQISWQVTDVKVANYGSNKDALLYVTVSLWPQNTFIAVLPKKELVLADIYGSYPGIHGTIVVEEGSHEPLGYLNEINGTVVYSFRKRNLER